MELFFFRETTERTRPRSSSRAASPRARSRSSESVGLQAYRQNRKDEERYQGILRDSVNREVDRRSEDSEVRGDHEEDDAERDDTHGEDPKPEGEKSAPGMDEDVDPNRR